MKNIKKYDEMRQFIIDKKMKNYAKQLETGFDDNKNHKKQFWKMIKILSPLENLPLETEDGRYIYKYIEQMKVYQKYTQKLYRLNDIINK